MPSVELQVSPLRRVLARHRVLVVRRRFEDADVSGILFRDGDHHVIGVNSAHPLVRQRFTIALELGHRRFTQAVISSLTSPSGAT